jgi:hypothetical protein
MTRAPRDKDPLCPICHQPVTPTRNHNIAGHLDRAQHPCPGSYELPYDLAITDPTPSGGAA